MGILLVLLATIGSIWLLMNAERVSEFYNKWKASRQTSGWNAPPTNPEDDPTFWPPLIKRKDNDPPTMV